MVGNDLQAWQVQARFRWQVPEVRKAGQLRRLLVQVYVAGEAHPRIHKQGNDKIARNMESAHKTSLAKGGVGIREKKPSPSLAEFIDKRFEPWAKASFEKTSPKTWLDWYRPNLRAQGVQATGQLQTGGNLDRENRSIHRASAITRIAG